MPHSFFDHHKHPWYILCETLLPLEVQIVSVPSVIYLIICVFSISQELSGEGNEPQWLRVQVL